MKLRRHGERQIRIEMTPFMDVMFLLLVFFIYAMLSMSVHRAMPVKLPSSSAASVTREVFLSLTVTADGRVSLDGIPVSLEELTPAVAKAAASMKEPAVDLFAAREVSYQALFRVMDRVTAAGIHRVSLQAAGEEPAP